MVLNARSLHAMISLMEQHKIIIKRDRGRDRQADRQRQTHGERETERDRETETERQKQRDRDRQADRQAERVREIKTNARLNKDFHQHVEDMPSLRL